MAYDSFREFLRDLKVENELSEIDVPVDKEWEIAAICRENFDKYGPALQFNQVKGYDTPLVLGVVGTHKRYSMGLGSEADIDSISETWQEGWNEPIEPEEIPRSEAPVKENTIEDVDLYDDPFPVPVWHEHDGGPELGTLHGVITQDPETGWVNVGIYRNEIKGEDILGCLVIPYRHIGQHWKKWKDRGEDMPVAIAIGLDPYLTVVGGTSVGAQEDEYDVAGGLKGEPIEVVQAENSELPVPARAEIVLEGTMPIDDFIDTEGPFGEFTGFMGGEREDSHYIEVETVTHRDDPIFQGTYAGRPPDENTTIRCIGRSAGMFNHLVNDVGIPGVVDASVTESGCAGFHTVVSIEKQYSGHVRDVMANVWGHPNLFSKHCTVVDDDIDPWDESRVLWAIHTRVQPARDIEIVEHGKSIELDPSQVPSKRGWSSWMGIDATNPTEYYAEEGEEMPPLTEPPIEWMEKVRERWDEYGIEGVSSTDVPGGPRTRETSTDEEAETGPSM